MAFLGKWKLVSSENFEEYMKELDVGMVMRKMANTATPVQEIVQDGDELKIKTVTTFKTTELKFKLGNEFDEHTADGRDVKTVVTQDGNKLVQVQKGVKGGKDGKEYTTTLTREFDGDDMKMVLTVGDIVCTRCYKKIE